MLLTVPVQPGAAATVLSVQGELDIATAPILGPQVQAALEPAPRSQVVDLTDPAFIDSGVCGLLRAAREAQRLGVP